MNQLINIAKDLFEKLKPVFMSEEKNAETAAVGDAESVTEEVETTTDDSTATSEPAPVEEIKDVTPLTTLNIVTAIFNGAGIGILLGTLLGLAISPVVSGIIGTLSGLLAVLLGISEKYISPLKSFRIGAFGFFCVGGILLGMYIRTNNGLLPSRSKMMTAYTSIGYTKEEALDFIAFREFGLAPASWTGGQATGSQAGDEESSESSEVEGEESADASTEESMVSKSGTVAKGQQSSGRKFVNPNETGADRKSLLYSSEVDVSSCYILDMAGMSQPVSEIKNTFMEAGGTWKELAEELGAGLPDKVYAQALLTLRDCFCESGASGVLKITNCAAVSKINSSQSLEQIKTILSASGQTWKTITEKIGKDIPVANQKTIFLSLTKILCHD